MAVMTTPPTRRYAEAVAWAVELHGPQMRKGATIPYLTHLLAVSSLVWEHGGDEDDAIAGLLHDAIEDTDASAADIEERFGPKVAAIVLACSDTTVRPKPPWRASGKRPIRPTSPIRRPRRTRCGCRPPTSSTTPAPC